MASSVEKKTKAADSEPEWMKSLLANLEQLRSSWRACEDEDFSWIEEHKNLIRPGEFLVATSNVKVDVSGNDVQDTEVDNPDVEPEDEDVSPEALAEEGESDDDSSTTIKDYLGDTYNNHIVRYSQGLNGCKTNADKI